MADVVPLLRSPPHGGPPRVAIFLSGGGSNAEHLLARARERGTAASYQTVCLVTDAPETSRARELGLRFQLPVIAEDIYEFYRRNGQPRVTIATPEGQRIRSLWSEALRARLAPLRIDFAVFAGFVPLTDLTGDFPCLNVHPGDLTYLKAGRRFLVGLHTVPIELAIVDGLSAIRSSVIVAQPYSGMGDDMDNGPILGISPPLALDLGGTRVEDLSACVRARPAKRPRTGYGDALETVAKANQERLKREGDWVVLPQVVVDFARGVFGCDRTGQLHLRIANRWHAIETVVYDPRTKEVIFRGRS